MTNSRTPILIVASLSLFTLIFCVIIAAIPRQFGADKHADPITHQCEQTESVTCGPAACVSALSWVGIDTTERAEVIACKTGPAGTYISDLAGALHGTPVPMPTHAPGRTFVVYINDTGPHFICAHDDPARGWLVNDPWHATGPESWQPRDFATAVGAVEVKP